MRVGLGVLAGLLIGLLVGFSCYYYWSRPRTEKAQVVSSKALLCKTNGLEDKPLLLRSVDGVLEEIRFPWFTDSNSFYFQTVNEFRYLASSSDPSNPEQKVTIDLSRVSGDMKLTVYMPREARKVLVNVCEKRVPANQCGSELAKVLGANILTCISTSDPKRCADWEGGSNVESVFHYSCKAGAQF